MSIDANMSAAWLRIFVHAGVVEHPKVKGCWHPFGVRARRGVLCALVRLLVCVPVRVLQLLSASGRRVV